MKVIDRKGQVFDLPETDNRVKQAKQRAVVERFIARFKDVSPAQRSALNSLLAGFNYHLEG